MDPNYANAGGGGVGIGGSAAAAAAVIPSGRYNAAFYKDSLVSCQRNVPTPYNTYDPYGGSSVKVSSAYPYDAEAEFKERTGMGKTKVLAGNTVAANSAKIQHHQLAYNQNSCYGGTYSQSNAPESANYYGYTYEQQQIHPYTQQQQQQQQQQQYHQSQLQQQYKYNKLVAAQQQQQQHPQQHHQHQHQHQHLQQQKIPPPEYGYTSYHHPYYHPHYHHPSSTQKGVAVMKTIPDASSSMPYVNSKMMTARAPQYPSNYNASYHHPQSSYPPVVTAGHQHTYQSQSVCEDSRWIWNSSGGNEYPSSSCRSATYSGYVNGSGASGKQQHNTMWPPHSMSMQYQSTGYPAAAAASTAVMASNQSCCPPPPPPTQSSTTTYYPQQYVKYPIHQSAVDYNNDLYGSSSQSNSAAAAAAAAVAASGKVYTDLSGNSYQQAINNPVAFHHQQQQQQPGEYTASPSSTLDYNCSRYLQQQQQHHQQQQQQQTESPSSLSSTSSSTSSYNHHYYHAYPTYSNVDAHPESYQQQVDTKIKSQSLRDFLTSWNEDEDEINATTEVPFMEQLHLNSDHFAQDNNVMGNAQPVMENHLQFKGSFSSSSRPKIHVGITVDSTVESDQYINLPDIIIDIEKSNKDIVSLPEDCLVANIPIIEKDDIFIKEENMPNIKEDVDEVDELEKEKYPKKIRNQVQREKKSLRRKCQNSKLIRTKQRFTVHRHNHKLLKVVRRTKKLICRRVKIKPPTCSVISQQYNPKSLKCLCVSLINSEKFRKRILGVHCEIDSLLMNKNNNNNTKSKIINTTTTTAENEGNIDAASVAVPSLLSSSSLSSASSSSSVIPKLSDLCKNALNSSFDRDVLVINLEEILDSDNLFVVQCDINENILGNFVEETEQLQQQPQQQENSRNISSRSSSSNSSISSSSNSNINRSTNNANEEKKEEEENLVEILNDKNNNYNNSGSGSNSRNVLTPVSTDIEQLKRCCSVTEVSNLPLDNSVEHNDFILTSINNPLVLQPLTSPTPPSPPATDGSISCPATLLCDDGRGHDRHSSHSSSLSLIEQNCLTQQQISVSHNKNNENDENDENDNNQQLHEMLMLSGIVQQHDIKINKDSKSFLPPTAVADAAAFDDSTLLLDSSKVVTTPSIHHEEIVPDNLKKFQNEKFLKYLHAKYVQGNLSEFYHANRIIKKYKKRIIKKLLNIVR